MFRSLLSILALNVIISPFAALAAPIPESGDYCLKQGFEILQNMFGDDHDIKFVEVFGAYPDFTNRLEYIYKVEDLCEGTFSLHASPGLRYNDCTRAHYGKTNHFSHITADKDCRQFVPRNGKINSF